MWSHILNNTIILFFLNLLYDIILLFIVDAERGGGELAQHITENAYDELDQ